jgi:hypothetical protein
VWGRWNGDHRVDGKHVDRPDVFFDGARHEHVEPIDELDGCELVVRHDQPLVVDAERERIDEHR